MLVALSHLSFILVSLKLLRNSSLLLSSFSSLTLSETILLMFSTTSLTATLLVPPQNSYVSEFWSGFFLFYRFSLGNLTHVHSFSYHPKLYAQPSSPSTGLTIYMTNYYLTPLGFPQAPQNKDVIFFLQTCFSSGTLFLETEATIHPVSQPEESP